MTIAENERFVREIEGKLIQKLPIKLGINKKNDLTRLIYEIARAKKLAISEIFNISGMDRIAEGEKGRLFHECKSALFKMRYPSLSSPDLIGESINKDFRIAPLGVDSIDKEYPAWDFKLAPETIFIEKDVQDLEWTKGFLQNFPRAEYVFIDSRFRGNDKEFRGNDKKFRGNDKEFRGNDIDVYNRRRENIFLVKNKSAFIKVCPCSKACQRCGYWILNIGFGCPVDCAYCYLQLYSNAPGLIFPANIEDYYTHIMALDKKLKRRTRIGTGEFTDSLAMDRYTNYASHLIPFFRKARNLVLELKTKCARIDNVLKEEPHDNVVISWSINTPEIAEKYEKGASSVEDRINAAREACQRGYRVAFHFDPVVCYPGWERRYKEIIKRLFSNDLIKQNTAWISLGTLRYMPGLKQTAERRFAETDIFYHGEFLLDVDGKMKYPYTLRIEMYDKVARWIRGFTRAWLYLCMEPETLWRETSLKKCRICIK